MQREGRCVDIVFVVDCGRWRETNYDPYTNVATLQVRLRFRV